MDDALTADGARRRGSRGRQLEDGAHEEVAGGARGPSSRRRKCTRSRRCRGRRDGPADDVRTRRSRAPSRWAALEDGVPLTVSRRTLTSASLTEGLGRSRRARTHPRPPASSWRQSRRLAGGARGRGSRGRQLSRTAACRRRSHGRRRLRTGVARTAARGRRSRGGRGRRSRPVLAQTDVPAVPTVSRTARSQATLGSRTACGRGDLGHRRGGRRSRSGSR